jgi:Helix-turn-helix of DDE superfamily endonuclease
MVLEYWRQYRTYFHIGQAYGISESAACRNLHHGARGRMTVMQQA